MLRPLITLALLPLLTPVTPTLAGDWEEVPSLAEFFEQAGVDGTFVLLDVATGALKGTNRDRAETRFIPASTFKIPNSLIGLETGTVTSVDEVLPYGGKPQRFEVWEKDMGLRDAIVISNVPIYQELARRIGLQKMDAGVKNLGYGNQEIGQVVDRFWLDGPLKISPIEQCHFLASLATLSLSVSKEAQKSVHEITLLEEQSNQSLHGKTGLSDNGGPLMNGWWVGWVESGEKIHTFALNMDVVTDDHIDQRVIIGRKCLNELGVFPLTRK